MKKITSHHHFAFRARYLAALVLVLVSFGASAQIFTYPNPGLFGMGTHRFVPDSTLYYPTGCGVPSGTASLNSVGFGSGQKLKMSAFYYDSCGHKLWVFDPSSSTWAGFSSGVIDTTSLSNRINLRMTYPDTTAMLNAYGRKNQTVANLGGAISFQEDVAANRPAAGNTGALFLAVDTKLLYRDNGGSWDLIGSGGGGSGSPNSNVGAGYRIAVASTNNIKTLFCVGCAFDSVSNANGITITVPVYVANNGAATGIKVGPFLSRPSAVNCQCIYIAVDSGTVWYDNGAQVQIAGIADSIFIRHLGLINGVYSLGNILIDKGWKASPEISPSTDVDSVNWFAIVANAIANSKLATMAANTIKGSVAGGTPADLSKAQVTAMLNPVTTALQGVAPAAPHNGMKLGMVGGVATWQDTTANSGLTNPMTTAGDMIVGGSTGTPARLAVPAHAGMKLGFNGTTEVWQDTTAGGGGGGTPGGANTQVQYNNSGAFGANAGLTYNATNHALSGDTIVALNSRTDSGYANNIRLHTAQITGDSAYNTTRSVIAIGNSLTAGAQASQPYFAFAYQLADYFNSNIINFGTPGQKLDGNTTSLIALVPKYNPSIHTAIFWEYGTNDAAGGVSTSAFQADLILVIDTCIARGWPANRIIVFTPSYAGTSRNTLNAPFVSPTQAACTATGAVFVDAYDYMRLNGGFALTSSDSTHPNDAGYAAMAKAALKAISSKIIPAGWQKIHGRLEVGGAYMGPGVLSVFGDAWINYLTVGLGASQLAGNTAFGDSAIYPINNTGTALTAVGFKSLANNLTGVDNTAIGWGTLSADTSGHDNTALGVSAMRFNLSGNQNVAAGSSAMIANTTGSGNSALGYASLGLNTTGGNNVSIGSFTLASSTTASNNVGVGAGALGISTTAFANTFIGAFSGNHITTGSQNTVIGEGAMSTLVTGANNTALGLNAGQVALGSGNLFLGWSAGLSETGSNKLYLSNSGTANLIYGDFNTSQLLVNAGSTPAFTTNTAFEVRSTTGGFMMPSYTTTAKNALTSQTDGNMYYDVTLHAPYYWNGTAMTPFGGAAFTNPMTTTNDMIFQTGGTYSRLAAPAHNGMKLTSVGGSLAWVDSTGATGLTLTTTGSSGAATLVGTTLNVPNYASSNSPGGSTNDFQSNNAGAFAGGAFKYDPTNLGLQLVTTSIGTGTTINKGSYWQNTDIASSGNQKFGPWYGNEGQGWKTTATAASEPVWFGWRTEPIQGTTTPTGNFAVYSSINSGTPTNIFNIDNNGQLIIRGGGAGGNSAITTQSGNSLILYTGSGLSTNIGANKARSSVGTSINNGGGFGNICDWYSSTDVLLMRFMNSGHLLLGPTLTDSSALLHISAGSTTLVPLKMTAGAPTTTPINGAFGEFDGANFFMVAAGTRNTIASKTYVDAHLPASVASNNLTGQTSANNSVIVYNTPASDQTFQVNAYTTITALVTDVLICNVTYTDESNTARTYTFFPEGTSTGNMTSTGSYPFPTISFRAKASTTITLSTVLVTGTGSITYNVGGTVVQIN